MDWVEILQRFGFPILVCAALAYAIWKMSAWVAKTVIEPLVKSHIEFIREQILFIIATKHYMVIQEKFSASVSADLDAQNKLLRELQATLAKNNLCRYLPPGPGKHLPT